MKLQKVVENYKICVIIHISGAVLVLTGVMDYELQVGGTR